MFEMNVVVFEIIRFVNIAPTYNEKRLILKFISGEYNSFELN